MADSPWSKRCRYSALANIFSVMFLAFVLIRIFVDILNQQEGSAEINPLLISPGVKYHWVFLIAAIVTIFARKRISAKWQQALFTLNLVMAVYMVYLSLDTWQFFSG